MTRCELYPKAKSQPELGLRREVLGWLIAARSGHGHFADYHERFGHEETDLRCDCGHRRTQLHPFSCPNARPHKDKIASKSGRQLSPDEILGTPAGMKKFAEWAPATGLFNRRYRVRSSFLRNRWRKGRNGRRQGLRKRQEVSTLTFQYSTLWTQMCPFTNSCTTDR